MIQQTQILLYVIQIGEMTCLKCDIKHVVIFFIFIIFFSVVGTSSLRRIAQVSRIHPHLKFESIVRKVNLLTYI